MVQDKAIVTMTNQYKVVYDLSNGTIFNDLEQPQTQISRSRVYYWRPRRIVCADDARSVCDS